MLSAFQGFTSLKSETTNQHACPEMTPYRCDISIDLGKDSLLPKRNLGTNSKTDVNNEEFETPDETSW